MAIVEMKRLTLLAPKADQERLLRALQKMRCVEISEPEADMREEAREDASALSQVREQLRRVDWALGELKRYDTAGKVMFGAYPEVSVQEAEAVWKERDRYMLLVSTLEDFERRRGDMKAQELRARNQIAQYEPWRDLDEAPETLLRGTRNVIILTGTLPNRDVPKLEARLSDLQFASCAQVGAYKDSACLIVAVHREIETDARAALEEAGFTPETFAPLGSKTTKEYLAELNEQLEDIQWDRDQMQDAAARMAGDIQGLKLLRE